MKDPRGFLIDLDGVLYVGDRPVDGAQEAIEYLVRNDFRLRFVSNTTRKCRKTIADRLSSMGFAIPVEAIFTPPLAAVAFMNRAGKRRCRLLTTGDVWKDFEGPCSFDPAPRPDFVILGDAGDRITYESLNSVFSDLLEGAELIALEKDRYWMAPDGLSLSAGPFVAALEYATGKTATVVGKPSGAFFDLALEDMGLRRDQVAMIGDDIMTDIGGAQKAGMRGILVRTGKFREDTVTRSGVRPDCIIDSIARITDIV